MKAIEKDLLALEKKFWAGDENSTGRMSTRPA